MPSDCQQFGRPMGTLKMIPASQAAENLREMQTAMRLDFTTQQVIEFSARFTALLSNYVPREVWAKCVSLANEGCAITAEYRNYRGLDDEVGYGLPKGKL